MNWSDLPLARATVDRAAERRSEPDLVDRLRADPATGVVLVQGGLVATAGDGTRLDLVTPDEAAALDSSADGWLFLGADDTGSFLARVLAEPAPDPTTGPDPNEGAAFESVGAPATDARTWSHMRRIGTTLSARDAGLGITAVALAAWHGAHRCCPRCGTPTVVQHAGWVRHCPEDGVDQYPRTDPAVIMAVVDDDDRLLLGRAATWPERRFSTLAGYVEPGEGLEQAVRREVDEEVGVSVGEVTYRGSQPWPFPASIMLAFSARATSTTIAVDGVEVTDARWFSRDALLAAATSGEVLLPSRTSIARALIEEWAGRSLPGE